MQQELIEAQKRNKKVLDEKDRQTTLALNKKDEELTKTKAKIKKQKQKVEELPKPEPKPATTYLTALDDEY